MKISINNEVVAGAAFVSNDSDTRMKTQDTTTEDNNAKDGITLNISAKGLQLAKEMEESSESSEETDENILEKLKKKQEERLQKEYEKQMEDIKNSGNPYEDLGKYMEIARRIAHGDKVPQKDEKRLMEFSAEMYQAAKAAATLHANEKHKKYDSLFDDEEDNQDSKLRELEQEDTSVSEEDGESSPAVVS